MLTPLKSFLLLAFIASSLQCTLLFGQIVTDDIAVPPPSNIPAKKNRNNDRPTKQLFLLLNAGLASPLGIFGSTNVLEEDAVYAKTGINLSLNVGRTFNRYVGLTATGGLIVQTNKMAQIVDNYNRYGPPGSYILAYDYPGMRFYYLAGGLLVTVPATNRFSIDVKLQGGIALGVDRELTLQIDNGLGTVIEKYGKASDVAFLPDLGLNFRLLVTDNFTMNFFTDFVMANFKFKDVTYYENGIPLATYDYDLPMRNLNVGIGAGWSFK